jgi:sec-independent protein translocase protein TatA
VIVIVVVLVLLFGAKRLPDAARSLGRSMRVLKHEVRAMHDDDELTSKNSAETGRPAQDPARQLDAQPSTVADPVERVRDK